jgi:hypothetical protein
VHSRPDVCGPEPLLFLTQDSTLNEVPGTILRSYVELFSTVIASGMLERVQVLLIPRSQRQWDEEKNKKLQLKHHKCNPAS